MTFVEVETITLCHYQPPPSLSSLSDELLEIILALVSRWSYPSLSLVSKRFHSLLSPPYIYKLRSRIKSQETCVYVCLWFPNRPYVNWFRLWAEPNVKLRKPKGRGKLGFNKDQSGTSVIPTNFSNSFDYPRLPIDVIKVDSKLYVIGGPHDAPSSSVRILDCRNHTWLEAPNMTVAREDPCTILVDEKIYVMGGYSIEEYPNNWFEVFDIKTQSWTTLHGPYPDELRICFREESRTYYFVEAFKGKIYLAMTNGKDYTYDTRDNTWEVVRGEPSFYYEGVGRWTKVGDIIYGYNDHFGYLVWSDFDGTTKGGEWKEIMGLEKLRECHPKGLGVRSVVSIGFHDEKLLVMWDPCGDISGKRKNNIWYAKISLESRLSCDGLEIWGNIECVDVLKFPGRSYKYLRCYGVSV